MRRFQYPLVFFLWLGLLTGCLGQSGQPETPAPEDLLKNILPSPVPTQRKSIPSIVTPINDEGENGEIEPTPNILMPLVNSGQSGSVAYPAPTDLPPSNEPYPSLPPEPTMPPGPPIKRNQFGVQIHLHREDLTSIMAQLRELGVGWVKVQVSWKIYQPEPDRLDDYRFGELDQLVEAAADNDIDVMLSIAKAPEWSRPTTEQDGPPGDPTLFQAFMNLLAARYKGQVAAYELWNEPNLQREWYGMPLSAPALVGLIQAGAAGVRAADSEAILISAAPATTGINDGITAIDDRVYLGQMIASGVTDHVDAIGAHPYGWANPPSSSAANPDPVSPSHNNHPSFFFADTLRDYRQLLDAAGQIETPIWVTEFGWGSYDGLNASPPPGVEYMGAVNEEQQAAYTIEAYKMAQDWPGIGPLILWNLNFAPTFGSDFVESSYSLFRPDGSARPVFDSLSSTPKVD